MEERVRFLREMKAKEKRGDAPATMDEVVLERRYSRKQSVQSHGSPSHAPTPPPVENMGAPINKVRFSENSVEVNKTNKIVNTQHCLDSETINTGGRQRLRGSSNAGSHYEGQGVCFLQYKEDAMCNQPQRTNETKERGCSINCS